MRHPSHELFEQAKKIKSLPNGVAPLTQQLQGTSFFPAGIGLYCEDCNDRPPKFPIGGIMVLAHDWGTLGDFDRYSSKDSESLGNPTWRNMLAFLQRAGIDPRSCFFTNFFQGIRTGSSSVGVFPGAKDASYVRSCQSFLVKQINRQMPRLILVLGAYVPKLISAVSEDLAPWREFESFKGIDLADKAIIHAAKFPGAHHCSSLVSLVHPCYRQLTAQRRFWNKFTGDDAEVEMVRFALQLKRGEAFSFTDVPPL